MKTISKTIPELVKEQQRNEAELVETYKLLGNKLFMDAADPSSNTKSLSSETCIVWQKLREERAFCTGTIIEIKNAVERVSELDRFLNQIENNDKSVKKNIKKKKKDFLFYLYRNFSSSCPVLFEKVQPEAAKMEEIIQGAAAELDILKKEKENAAFFSKLLISHKISSGRMRIKKLETEIKAFLNREISDISESEEIKKLFDAEVFSAEKKTEYETLLSLYNGLAVSKERTEMLTEEKKQAFCMLEERDADTPRKHIYTLGLKIKEIDAEIETMTQIAGKGYADGFYSENGKPLAAETDSFLAGAYGGYLKTVGSLRAQAEKLNLSIEWCKVSGQIESKKIKIENLKKTITNAKTEIENAEKRIAESENEIGGLESRAEKLCAQIEEVSLYGAVKAF